MAGFIEMREYTLQPEGHKPYIALSESTGDLRCSILPFVGAFTTESGADINRIYHFYWYDSFDARDAARGAGVSNKAWVDYVTQGRKHTRKQHSSVLQVPGGQPPAAVQAALQRCQQRGSGQHAAAGPGSGSSAGAPPVAYLLCTYQVPEEAVEQLLNNGSQAVAAGDASSSAQLMFVGCTAFGAAVGTIVELWRFDSAAAALQAQCAGSSGVMAQARRRVLPAGVAAKQQRVALLRPTKWSNMQ